MRTIVYKLLAALSVIIITAVPSVNAMTTADFACVTDGGTCHYDPNEVAACGDAGGSLVGVGAGNGSPTGATFPNLDPGAMAAAINKYILQVNPRSELKGLGATIVASSEKANVNPFLVVTIAQKESTLADPSVFNVSHGHNAFGRSAAAGQPSFQGSRAWYKWSSAKASVDYTAPENNAPGSGGDQPSFMRAVYADALEKDDFVAFFMKYAPPVENDTATYIAQIKSWLQKLVDMTEGGGAADAANPASETTDTSQDQCPTPGSTTTAAGDANMKQTTTVSTPGKFITLPSKYSCPGHTTKIDSRIAADVAYIATKYNLCADDGLASEHASHGAGVSVDMRPKGDNSSKDVWKNSAEAAARAIGWFGDSATEPNKTQPSCAKYIRKDTGQCMHIIYPDKFPKWLRWLGYNGASCHGDPWHVYDGCGAHIHIGWDAPNSSSAVSPVIIGSPIDSVYTFPAPIPDDLKDLIK